MQDKNISMQDFDYELPPGRIARYPAEKRDESRLLVVQRASEEILHRGFTDIVDFFDPADLLVVNETRVFPARLVGFKPTGAPAEVFLLCPASDVDEYVWEALVRPGSKLKPGTEVVISEGLRVSILDGAPGNGRLVRLETDLPLDEALDQYGQVPLPPYLERPEEALDRERYQTIYAKVRGSVAAPTAGLHFSKDIMARLKGLGVQTAAVVLHIGMGTFRPVDVEDVNEHEMHEEAYNVPHETVEAIEATKARGGRVWAVGTTVVRTLESVAGPDGSVQAGAGTTRLFIRPGFSFNVVDRMITNFHLPRSTLLMLVGAFSGVDTMKGAYQAALANGYRFYSYGDAMVVL